MRSKSVRSQQRHFSIILFLAALALGFGGGPAPVRDLRPSAAGGQVAAPSQVHAYYLGGNSWAVRIGNRLLIFDYVAEASHAARAPSDGGFLPGGPASLDSLHVIVFVSHEHLDHYDPVIHEWRGRVPSIQYVFGWEEGERGEDLYLVGPRGRAALDGVRISTVNSNQDGVPEVAYLVQVDGWTIYHNGDYRGETAEDFRYLRDIGDRVDLAFLVSGWPQDDHPLFGLARDFVRILRPTTVFLMDRVGQERRTDIFAQFLTDHGVVARYLHGDLPGDVFVVSRDSLPELPSTR